MKKFSTMFLLACLVFCSFIPAFSAEEFTYEDGKVDLVCPDGWKHTITEESLTMGSPDGAVQFVFELLEADDLVAGIEQAHKEINAAVGTTTFGEPVEEKINGMDALTFTGTCPAKGLEIMLSIIDTPADNALCVYYFAAKAAEETHAAGIAEVINGIRPAVVEAAGDEETDADADAGDEEEGDVE
ncbi:MAG TPA: hypothetical protein DCG57_17215 [Candidatus Riflebacteria bacterium]|nr:hypothetical protein [Candidatus Riflebacteria bacterium]